MGEDARLAGLAEVSVGRVPSLDTSGTLVGMWRRFVTGVVDEDGRKGFDPCLTLPLEPRKASRIVPNTFCFVGVDTLGMSADVDPPNEVGSV